jgi:hypothetical protein
MSRWPFTSLLRVAGLLGVALVIVGYFPPFVIRTDYSPAGPYSACPAYQTVLSLRSSLWELAVDAVRHAPTWWYMAGAGFVYTFPVLLLLAAALAGLRNARGRTIFALGLACAVVALLLTLGAANFLLYFRLHLIFMLPAKLLLRVRPHAILLAFSPAVGGCPPGPSDVHMFGAGLWLLLSGYLVSLVSNLIHLLRPRPRVAPRVQQRLPAY